MRALTFCITSALLAGTSAFAPQAPVAKPKPSSLFSTFPGDKSSAEKAFEDLKSRINLGSLADNVSSMTENAMAGETGSRGEIWTAGMAALILCVAAGNIPVIGGATSVVFGPGLLLGGLALTVLGVSDLGDSLSPFPQPVADKGLVTQGIYAKIRHPIYAGIVAALAGASVMTDSASRLLLTAILFYVADLVADKEEEQLQEMYPDDFGTYLVQVPGKYFPKDFFEELTAGLKKGEEEDSSEIA